LVCAFASNFSIELLGARGFESANLRQMAGHQGPPDGLTNPGRNPSAGQNGLRLLFESFSKTDSKSGPNNPFSGPNSTTHLFVSESQFVLCTRAAVTNMGGSNPHPAMGTSPIGSRPMPYMHHGAPSAHPIDQSPSGSPSSGSVLQRLL
ncbi:unnamed protein product, partial [Nesidiocoris tenuis]